METIKVEQAIEYWGISKTAEMITILKDGGSKNLVNEIEGELVGIDNDIQFNIIMPAEARFASEGREKGAFPNIGAIEKWAESRGIDKKFAFGIAKNIAKFGTKESGLHFLEKFKSDEKLISTVAKGYKDDVKQELIKMIDKS